MKSFWLFFAALFASSCNHLFYHPMKESISNPEKIGLKYEPFIINTSDGEKLAAWKIPAQGEKIGSVLHFHGNAENMTTHFAYVVWLVAYGFDVFVFDYRGYGDSSGSTDRQGLVNDGIAALQKVDEGGDPFFVVAQSLGGAVAIPAIAQSSVPNLKALVVESSFANYRRIARKKLANIWLTWPLQYPLSLLISSGWDPEDFAPKLNLPTAVIHGDRDPVIPLTEGRIIFDSLNSKDKLFWVMPGAGHTQAFQAHDSPFKTKLVAFFCSHHPEKQKCIKRTKSRQNH